LFIRSHVFNDSLLLLFCAIENNLYFLVYMCSYRCFYYILHYIYVNILQL